MIQILLGLSFIAILIIAIIVLLIIALVVILKKIRKEAQHVAEQVQIKMNKSQILVSNKSQFLSFLKKVSKRLLTVIQNINSKLLAEDLLNQKSTHALIQSIQKIKKIFTCINYQGMRNILCDDPSNIEIPPRIAQILAEQIKLICKQQGMNIDSFIECFDFYNEDRDILKFTKQFQEKVKKIIDKKFQQYLPQVPNFLTKQKVLQISKKSLIQNLLLDTENSSQKNQYKSDHTGQDSNIYSFILTDAQDQENIKKLGKNQLQRLHMFNSAVCRLRNDEQFIKEYQQIQRKTNKVMQDYYQQIRKGNKSQQFKKKVVSCIQQI